MVLRIQAGIYTDKTLFSSRWKYQSFESNSLFETLIKCPNSELWITDLLIYKWGRSYSFISLSFPNIRSPWELRPCFFKFVSYHLIPCFAQSICSIIIHEKIRIRSWMTKEFIKVIQLVQSAQTCIHNSWLLTLYFFPLVPVQDFRCYYVIREC